MIDQLKQTVSTKEYRLSNGEIVTLTLTGSEEQRQRIIAQMNDRIRRIPVIQDGKQIGTLPRDFNPDPSFINSRSRLYDPRPGDFKRDGDRWIASNQLGGSDLEAVPGFVWDRKQ